MSESDPDEQTIAGFGALNQVLAAEKAAASRIEGARKSAAGILHDAQDEARRIADRADRRVQLLHRRYRKGLRRARSDMAAEFEAERAAHESQDMEQEITEATTRLARLLIGLAPK